MTVKELCGLFARKFRCGRKEIKETVKRAADDYMDTWQLHDAAAAGVHTNMSAQLTALMGLHCREC